MGELAAEEFSALNAMLGTLRLPYVPHEPTAKQEIFLLLTCLEAFFGGAAGPGKSWGLLMAAAQYADIEGYHALLLRPTLTEFKQEGGLIEVSHEWFGGIRTVNAPSWNGSDLRWTFPSKATIRFGYLANMTDVSHYKGGGVAFVGYDELTSFPSERLYTSLFRLLRRGEGRLPPGIPLRMRAASNPGDVGHQWVKERFVEPLTRVEGAVYVPAKIYDNPFLDIEEYLQSLAHLHPVDRQRLIDGDWDVMEEGGKFKRRDFKMVSRDVVGKPVKKLRYWDLAGTEPSASNPSPDYSVGLLYQVDDGGTFTVLDVVLGQWNDDEVEKRVRETAEEDGRYTPVHIEQDPGQAGKSQLSNYTRRVLQGFPVRAGHTKINGNNVAKEVRARPVAAAVGNGLVQVVEGIPNLREFFHQVTMFPSSGIHDDCVDALSGAHNTITGRSVGGKAKVLRSKGRIPDSTSGARL